MTVLIPATDTRDQVNPVYRLCARRPVTPAGQSLQLASYSSWPVTPAGQSFRLTSYPGRSVNPAGKLLQLAIHSSWPDTPAGQSVKLASHSSWPINPAGQSNRQISLPAGSLYDIPVGQAYQVASHSGLSIYSLRTIPPSYLSSSLSLSLSLSLLSVSLSLSMPIFYNSFLPSFTYLSSRPTLAPTHFISNPPRLQTSILSFILYYPS